MRLIFFGSGDFGLPTLRKLTEVHDVVLAVSQPDRPAGRKRTLTPTPISRFAQDHSIEVFTPEKPNEPQAVARIRAAGADAYVVVAYGHKLGVELLDDLFAFNLHGSLLPKYRGAAPINWAVINGERETGVSVITLAQMMDAGELLARAATPIEPTALSVRLDSATTLTISPPVSLLIVVTFPPSSSSKDTATSFMSLKRRLPSSSGSISSNTNWLGPSTARQPFCTVTLNSAFRKGPKFAV